MGTRAWRIFRLLTPVSAGRAPFGFLLETAAGLRTVKVVNVSSFLLGLDDLGPEPGRLTRRLRGSEPAVRRPEPAPFIRRRRITLVTARVQPLARRLCRPLSCATGDERPPAGRRPSRTGSCSRSACVFLFSSTGSSAGLLDDGSVHLEAFDELTVIEALFRLLVDPMVASDVAEAHVRSSWPAGRGGR